MFAGPKKPPNARRSAIQRISRSSTPGSSGGGSYKREPPSPLTHFIPSKRGLGNQSRTQRQLTILSPQFRLGLGSSRLAWSPTFTLFRLASFPSKSSPPPQLYLFLHPLATTPTSFSRPQRSSLKHYTYDNLHLHYHETLVNFFKMEYSAGGRSCYNCKFPAHGFWAQATCSLYVATLRPRHPCACCVLHLARLSHRSRVFWPGARRCTFRAPVQSLALLQPLTKNFSRW